MLKRSLLAAVSLCALAVGARADQYGPSMALGANTSIGGAAISALLAQRLNKSGDTMGPGALLGITLDGAPTFASLQQILADIGAFYAYGGKADGAPHPLFGITSFAGLNTTGYTLAQWQALFAGAVDQAGNNPVTALTNEADEVAVQAVINTRVNRQAQYYTGLSTIYLPSGFLRETHPIRAGCQSISTKGTGMFGTVIQQTVPLQDGWHHGTSDTACPATSTSGPNAKFDMEDMSIACTNFCGTALVVSQNAAAAGFTMRNVQVPGGTYTSGNATTKGSGPFFRNGLDCRGCANASFYNASINGPYSTPAIGGFGVSFAGWGADGYNWYGGQIGGFHLGVVSYTGQYTVGTNSDIEGISFDGLNANEVDDMFTTIYSGTGGGGGPQYYVLNGQFGTINRHFLNLTDTEEVQVKNNLTYTTGPFLVMGGTVSTSSLNATNLSYLGSNPPTVGEVITGPYALYPLGTTITAVDQSAGTFSTSNYPSSSGQFSLSAQPTTAFVATEAAGSPVLTGVSVIDGNAQIGGCVMSVAGVTGCDSITAIDGYNMTVTVATAPNTSTTGSLTYEWAQSAPCFMCFASVQDMDLQSNDFEFGPGNALGNVAAFTGSSNIHVDSNNIQDFGNVIGAGFVDNGGNSNLIEKDDIFGPIWNNTGSSVVVSFPFASNSQTVRWGSYYKSLGCDLGTSGKVTCAGTYVGALSSTTDLTVPLPPAFLQAPSIVAGNGDFGVSSAACGPKGAPATASFLAGCSSGAGSNVRINFSATGY